MTLSSSTKVVSGIIFALLLSVSVGITHASAQSQSGTGTQAPTTGTGTAGPSTPTVDKCGNPTSGTIVNPLQVCSLTALLDIILDAVIKLGTVILTLALIWTGFKFVAARGNPEAVSSARSALLWTLIGGLILLGAKGIETVIQATVTAL